MSLLSEIQSSLMEEKSEIGPILLKLRFLASRLGSDLLEEWVRHESEGYPSGIEIPEYRKISVSYTGTFNGPFGSGVKNAPIPPYLIEKFCGESWNTYSVRQSVAAIDSLLGGKDDSTLQINASNLILLLNGKVYEDYSCLEITGTLSKADFVELQYSVRSKILELTIEIEKAIPSAADVIVGSGQEISKLDSNAVTQITNQVFHGNYTSISSSGANANISLSFSSGDKEGMIGELVKNGIAQEDATAFAEILENEPPSDGDEPWGPKAREWLGKNLKKAGEGAWNVGISVATKVMTEAALKYYGLK